MQIQFTLYRGGLGSKGLCYHPYKKIQKARKIPPKGPFLTFCMGDCEGLRNQCRIATIFLFAEFKRNFLGIAINIIKNS
jgi:hypothetical protein